MRDRIHSFMGSRLATYSYAAIPSAKRDWITYSFLQFESNVRAGVVLGMIGTMGLGFKFLQSFTFDNYHRAGTFLLVIILLTVVIDRISRLLKVTRA